jgi:hypothetical protein
MNRLWHLLWLAGFIYSLPFVLLRLTLELVLWASSKASWFLVRPGIWAMGVASDRTDGE